MTFGQAMATMGACSFMGVAFLQIATAQDAVSWGWGDWVSSATVRPTEQAGAVAEVEFINRAVNSDQDEGATEIALGDLALAVTFDWDAGPNGADRITVTPPLGYIAVPEQLTVGEGLSGVLHIYPEQAVGF